MFDYLKKYGLSDEEVNALTNSLEENDLYSLMNQYRVEKDLEYFSTLGINNHKQIIFFYNNIRDRNISFILV